MLLTTHQWRQATGALALVLVVALLHNFFTNPGHPVVHAPGRICGAGRPCSRAYPAAYAGDKINPYAHNANAPPPGKPLEKDKKPGPLSAAAGTTAAASTATKAAATTTPVAPTKAAATTPAPITAAPTTTTKAAATTAAPTTAPPTPPTTTKAAATTTIKIKIIAAASATTTAAAATQKPAAKTYPCLSEMCKDKSSCCCMVPPVAKDAPKNTPDLNTVPAESPLIARLKGLGIQQGGYWSPTDCKAERLLAVIIPFRNRESHLLIYLNYMHEYLQRQKLAHAIYVIDQADNLQFNRAMLFNVGFREAMAERKYTCLVFHDIDNIPVDQMLNYRCDAQPVHMSARTDKWNWGLPYGGFVGGVTKQQPSQVEKMNGFPNRFWGWGGEDDDILVRWVNAGLKFHRPADNLGNYATIKRDHFQSSQPNPDRFHQLQITRTRLRNDGLSNLKYTVRKVVKHDLYTRIVVELAKLN